MGTGRMGVYAWIISLFVVLLILGTLNPAQATLLTRTLFVDDLLSVSYPENGWSTAREANVYKLLNVPAEEQAALTPDTLARTAQIMIYTEFKKDHAEALHWLKTVEAERDVRPTFLNIGGWPALQRRYLMPKPQPGQGSSAGDDEMILGIDTAVAAGALVVRLQGLLPADAPQETIDEVEAIGRSLTFPTTGDPTKVNQEIKNLRSSPPLKSRVPRASSMRAAGAELVSEASPGATVRVGINASELEIAVSNNGQNIVVGSNGGYFFSTNGGQTFSASAGIPSNDPSLAVGLSGTFYAANISGNSTGFWASTNNGQTFTARTNAFTCPGTPPNCGGFAFPDQAHIGADRFNAGTNNADRVYSAWRNGGANYGIVCSSDGGNTWGTSQLRAGDFPRIAVAQNGIVFVVYRNGNNINVDRYNPCDNNNNIAASIGSATPVTGVSDVTCPVPGLDRCNSGNLLSSHMVAVDDTNANHVYLSYAVNTVAGTNENVLVRDSTDGGATWPAARVVQANGAVNTRRYMPWICTTGGTALISWYDRRAATPCATPPCAANNDLTDYYANTASLDGGGNLTAGTEFKISDVSDPECASGWPCVPRSLQDSQSCSVQPQLAGACCLPGGTNQNPCPAGSSGTRCDPDTTTCATGETCIAFPLGGCPKYGDYNGNACIGGRFYATWASATPPAGIPASGNIDAFFSAFKILAPTANPDGPYTTNEGTFITLNGSGSTDPRGQPLTYEWDFNNDGVFGDATGPNPVFNIVGRNGFFTIALRVTNTSGFSDVAQTTVTVNNLPPVVTIDSINPAQPDPGQPFELQGSFTDPSWLDDHTARILWGDGKTSNPTITDKTNTPPASTGKVKATHTYCAPGVYTATLEIKDDSGVAGTDTGTDTKTITADLGPDSPGVIKTSNYLTFLTWTHTVPGTLGSANFQWRNGVGDAAMWWIYRNLTGDWLFFFVITANDNSTFNPNKPASSRNFLAIAVPTIEFKRWFWCGVPLYDKNGHFIGYGCDPNYGPATSVLHPWVQQRITKSLPHILKILANTLGGTCP